MLRKISVLLLLVVPLLVRAQKETKEQYSDFRNISVNDKFSNFGTSFYGKNQVVFASPKRKSFVIRNNWKGNNQPFLDLFIGIIGKKGELKKIKSFSEELNTRYHESNIAVTKDLKTVYFSRNNYLGDGIVRDSTGTGLIQLYRAKIDEKGKWTNVEPMPFNNDQYQTGHPALSSDEKTLYFISDMPGTLGKTDVFKTSISEDGTIGKPVNMGPIINTPEREMFVTINGKDEMYFSSDGRANGYGGLDVYAVKIRKDEITKPFNLGKPINSKEDDFSFIVNYDTKRGYLSSKRDGGEGDDDIYTFIQNYPVKFTCNQLVSGVVTEKTTGEILPDALVTLFDDEGKELNRMYSNSKGEYNFDIACNKNYKVVASKNGYSKDEKTFFSKEEEELHIPLSLTINEFIVERGKCIVKINPIYFDFDKYNIRPDASRELDKVIEVMRKYPELIIEGGSHTDSRGRNKYNETLSQNRANSTVAYIVRHGISSTRISAKGYGETQTINGCTDGVKCTETEHQFNRRTEFVVVNSEEIRKLYPNICELSSTSTIQQIKEGVKIKVDPKK